MSESPSVSATGSAGVLSPSDIDTSCRWPLLALYGGAAVWLVVAAVAALLASLSFHAPAIFADCEYSSYGRMAPVAKNALLYGFCLPAGWAAALWMLSRLGGVRLPYPLATFLAARVWHVGILVGVVGLVLGHGNGFEKVEFPRYAAWLLLAASVIIGVSGLGALLSRRSKEMYPSQWFAALGVLWFPWIYSTVTLLLQVWPVRGIAQAAVHGWYLAHLEVVLLGLLGLGALFYFIPVLRKQALHSRELALFTLVGLILCGGWVGASYTVPLPAWMGALGKVATLFVLLAVWTAFMNVRRTQGGGSASVELRFFMLGLYALLAWGVVLVLQRATPLGVQLDFTVAQQGLFTLLVAGFSALVGLGGAYFLLPRVTGRALPWQALVKAHFWLAAIALVLTAMAFLAGGFLQGSRLADAQVPFSGVVQAYLMPIRMATLGELLGILGSLLFALNVMRLIAVVLVDSARGVICEPAGTPALAEGRA